MFRFILEARIERERPLTCLRMLCLTNSASKLGLCVPSVSSRPVTMVARQLRQRVKAAELLPPPIDNDLHVSILYDRTLVHPCLPQSLVRGVKSLSKRTNFCQYTGMI